MAALNENALLLEFANVFVGDDEFSLVDLGAVRNVNFTGVQNPVDIRSDNRGSVVRKNRLNGQVNFDWLEAGDMDNMEILLKGLIDKTVTAGVLVPGAIQVKLSGSWAYNGPFVIENQNGDLSLLTINSVTGSVDGALVADTDYFVGQNAAGETTITVIDSATVTTEAQDLTIDYDYTPNASTKIEGGASKVSTSRFVRLIGPSADDPLKTRQVTLQAAVIESDVVFPFLDTEEAGDVGVFPVTLTSDKSSLWDITDEINP